MNTKRIRQKGNTKFIAHRGLSGLEVENTIPAFIAAGNLSYFGIETDIHKTLDDKFVIIHDDSTGRVAIDDYVVEKTDYNTLRSLVLSEKNGEKGRDDLRLPNLEEYIEVCKKYGKVAVLELKNTMPKKDIYEICRQIEALDYMKNVIFISFSLENLLNLRKKYPKQAAQYLVTSIFSSLITTLVKNNLDVDISFKALTKDAVYKFHQNNILVNCWTVDEVEVAERLISYGVDMITTNICE